MAAQVRELTEERVLAEAAQRYSLTTGQLRPLMVDEGTHVYAYERQGIGFILKWTPSMEKRADRRGATRKWLCRAPDPDD